MRVLAVDDNDTNLEVARNLCDVLGLECEVAHDGSEAVERVRARQYDLILMDICMPVMDGVEAAQQIQALHGDADAPPIIAVTANAEKTEIARYQAAGMCAVVSKPVDVSQLINAIHAAIGPQLKAS